jgi:hypothetical protein
MKGANCKIDGLCSGVLRDKSILRLAFVVPFLLLLFFGQAKKSKEHRKP